MVSVKEPNHDPHTHRILVVVDESCLNANLCQLVTEHIGNADAEVLVTAPALHKRMRHYVSDTDDADRRADRVLSDTLDCMRRHGISARGQRGDPDPLMAMDDWLSDFAADEIIIATHPADQLNWLERDIVEKARRNFHLPVTHAVIERPRATEGVFVP